MEHTTPNDFELINEVQKCMASVSNKLEILSARTETSKDIVIKMQDRRIDELHDEVMRLIPYKAYIARMPRWIVKIFNPHMKDNE